MEIGLIMALSSVAIVLAAAVLAYFNGTLLPKQMMMMYPSGFSFSFIANGAMWGNLVLISLVLFVIGKYADEWSGKEIVAALVLGIVVSYALFHFVYLNGKFPDSLAGGGRPISPAGWLMMAYGGVVIAIIILFYFHSNATQMDITVIGILLILYILVANHVVLSWLDSLYSFPWCPAIFTEESTPLWFIIGGDILVAVATAVKLLL